MIVGISHRLYTILSLQYADCNQSGLHEHKLKISESCDHI